MKRPDPLPTPEFLAATFAGGIPPGAVTRRPLPCVSEGNILEACPSCGADDKHVRECDRFGKATRVPNDKVKVPAVCNVGRPDQCPHYVADASMEPAAAVYQYPPPAPAKGDPWLNPVAVPPPPAFAPKSPARRGLVTVAAGEKGRALWRISRPTFEAYAARVGAELVCLTWEGNPAFGMTAKFGIGPVAAAFDEVLYADADIIFQPASVDLFALRRDPRAVLAFNDLPFTLEKWTGLPEEYQRVRESQRMPRVPIPWYLNTGLVVMSREHAPHIAPPPRPIPRVHCAEQHLWVGRIYESGCPVEFMTADAHWQWWIQGTMRDAPPWSVLHFSGMGDDRRRLDEMRHVAAAVARAGTV